MEFETISSERFNELKELQIAYKAEIGEVMPQESDFNSLKVALEEKQINFLGCTVEDKLIACCSICYTYSTFNYEKAGVFEDFYIRPEYRHKGIARKLVRYAFEMSQLKSLTVGCADCDLQMYKSIGFRIELGNMLAWEDK